MLTVTPGTHAHDVELDDTFDFLNTHELQDGVPIDHLLDLSIALDWFVEPRRHPHGGRRSDPGDLRVASGPRRAGSRQDPVRATRDARTRRRDRRGPGPRQRGAGTPSIAPSTRARSSSSSPAKTAASSTTDTSATRSTTRLRGSPTRSSASSRTVIRTGSACAPATRAAGSFYDGSRSGRRRWCDMTTCGNRAKAARHRAKAKTSEAASTEVPLAGLTPAVLPALQERPDLVLEPRHRFLVVRRREACDEMAIAEFDERCQSLRDLLDGPDRLVAATAWPCRCERRSHAGRAPPPRASRG